MNGPTLNADTLPMFVTHIAASFTVTFETVAPVESTASQVI